MCHDLLRGADEGGGCGFDETEDEKLDDSAMVGGQQKRKRRRWGVIKVLVGASPVKKVCDDAAK